MKNTRSKIVLVGIFLSIGMILSSCDNGGNQTDISEGGNSVSDVDKNVVTEENQTVEPKAIELLSTNVNGLGTTVSFNASRVNGSYVRLALASNRASSKVKVRVTINNKIKEYVLNSDKKGLIEVYQLTSPTNKFTVLFEVTNGVPMSIDVRARQYEQDPS